MGLGKALGGAYGKLIAGPARKAVVAAAYHLIGKHAAAIERGEHGSTAQRIYSATKGLKRITGALLFLLAGVETALGQLDAAAWIAGIGGFLLAAGLVDAEWWRDAPETIHAWRMYAWARDHAQAIFAGLELAGGWLHTCTPATAQVLAFVHVEQLGWTLTCESAGTALMIAGAVMSVAGLSAEARLAEPPAAAAVQA